MKKKVVDTKGGLMEDIRDANKHNRWWLEHKMTWKKEKKVVGIMWGVMKEFRDDKKGDGGCHAWWDQQWNLKAITHNLGQSMIT
jgi:hypothetical protein